jgi:hypothetical protein
MKQYSGFLLLVGLVIGCAVVPQYALHQEKFFPEGIEEVYLGMPGKFLDKTRKTTQLELVTTDTDSTRVVYREQHSGKVFEEVLYFTDASKDQALYEMQVVYPEGTNVFEEAVKLYGDPNSDEGEWFFKTEEDFNIIVWIRDQGMTISAREIRKK